MKNKSIISTDIKTRHKGRRWMRCINADDLEDYVDIPIGGGSNNDVRHTVLEIADFIGGDWRGSALEKGIRVVYDYYYLYYRDEDGTFDDTGNGEYSDGKAVGLHRCGDYITVDMKTNKIVKQRPFDKPADW